MRATPVEIGRSALACALVALMVTACSAGPYSEASPAERPTTTQTDGSSGRPSTQDGAAVPLDDGLTIIVSSPKSFTPTASAYPQSPRAVAFEMTIHNEASTVYRPTQLSVTATADGAEAPQLIDPTQGYTGVITSTEDVRPGQSLSFVVAFAMPTKQCTLELIVHADASADSVATVFHGNV